MYKVLDDRSSYFISKVGRFNFRIFNQILLIAFGTNTVMIFFFNNKKA